MHLLATCLRKSETVSLFCLALASFVLGACPDEGAVDDGEVVYCVEPDFVAGQPMDWATCGCNREGGLWREACLAAGNICSGGVGGSTCRPPCDDAERCPAFLGEPTRCHLGFCELPCGENYKDCPAPLMCDVDEGRVCTHDHSPEAS